MAEAISFAVHPTDENQMLILWSDGRITARGGMVGTSIDYQPDDDDQTSLLNNVACDLHVTEWLTPSGYVGTRRGTLFAFGAAGGRTNGDVVVPAHSDGVQRWRAFAVNPAMNGQAYRMDTSGRLENIGGAPAIAGQSTAVVGNSLARALAFDWASKKYIVVSGEGRLVPLNGAALGPGRLPPVINNWDRVVAVWVDPTSWATGARGVIIDVYGSMFDFGGFEVPESFAFDLHWETSVVRDLVVIDPDPLVVKVLLFNGEPRHVVASTPPEVVVSGPRKTETDTTRPTITWKYDDPEGDAQRWADVRVFSKAQRQAVGWTVDSPAFHSARVSGSDNAYELPVDLANGTWVVLVRASDTAGRVSLWSEEHLWRQGVTYPDVPVLLPRRDTTVVGPAAVIGVGADPVDRPTRKAILGGSLTAHAANYAGRNYPGAGWDIKYPINQIDGREFYGGGTLPAWALDEDDRRAALTAYEADQPAPALWWWQILLHDVDLVYSEAQLKAQADDVLAFMLSVHDVPVYVSPSPAYEPGTRCTQDDENTLMTEAIVAHLLANHAECRQGPAMPLVEARLVQPTSCHLLDEGLAVQAAVLIDFFAPSPVAFTTSGVAAVSAAPELDRAHVTVHGAPGTFGTWAPPLPRGHTGATDEVAGLGQPAASEAGAATVAPDGQVVWATSGSPERVSAPFFNPDAAEPDQDYVVEFPTTTGLLSTSTGSGNGGAPVGKWHPIRTPLGWRLLAFSPAPDDDQEIAVDGEWPALLALRKRTAAGVWAVEPRLTFTATQLHAAAVTALGSATADALFPSATNSHGESRRTTRGFVSTAVLADRQHIAVALREETTGRSGALMIIDGHTGTPVAFHQIADQETPGGDLLELRPVQMAASPVDVEESGVQRFSVVYDVAVGATGWPAMAQVFSFNAETLTVEPETAAFLPVTDFLTGAETYPADFSYQAGRAGWDSEGNLWLAVVGADGIDPSMAGFTHLYCSDGALYTEAAATTGWEATAGVQPSPDSLVVPPKAGVNTAAVGIVRDAATGRMWEEARGGYVNVYTPDAPLVARAELLANPDFAADVTGWSSPDGTATLAHSTDNDGRLVATKAGAGSEAAFESDAEPIPAEFRTGRHTIGGYADLTAITTARDVRVDLVLLNDANVAVYTAEGRWRPSTTAGERRAYVATLAISTATQARLVVRFRGATNGDEMAVEQASLRFAPVTPHDYIDLNLGALPTAGVPGPPALDSARSTMWVPVSQPAAASPAVWLFGIGTTPASFATADTFVGADASLEPVTTPHYSQVVASADGGATWYTVAEKVELSDVLTGRAYDGTVPSNREVLFRHRVWREQPGYVSSEWGPDTPFSILGVTDGYLSDPTEYGSAVAVPVTEWRFDRERRTGVFHPDGRPDAVVRRGVLRARKGTLPLRLLDEATHDAVIALLATGRTLLYRHVFDSLFFAPLNDAKQQQRAMPLLGEPWDTRHAHTLDVEAVEVARP